MGIFLHISYLWAFPCIFPTCGYFSVYFLLVGIFLCISYLWAFLCVFLACGHFSVDFFNQGWDLKNKNKSYFGHKDISLCSSCSGVFPCLLFASGLEFLSVLVFVCELSFVTVFLCVLLHRSIGVYFLYKNPQVIPSTFIWFHCFPVPDSVLFCANCSHLLRVSLQIAATCSVFLCKLQPHAPC